MRKYFALRKIIMVQTVVFLTACNYSKEVKQKVKVQSESALIEEVIPVVVKNLPSGTKVPKGMVWIPGGTFTQGAVDGDNHAIQHEKPSHDVVLDGFFMDEHEVTNAQFIQFVEQTGYVTLAERDIDWNEIKKQLPPGTPKPQDSVLQPGSLVFKKDVTSIINLFDYSQWWQWTIGAHWRMPDGPGSSIEGKEDYPVVHIAYEDALAYCKWAGRKLPTEAQWEYAARGATNGQIFFWGNNDSGLATYANTWEGEFPTANSLADGFSNRAPVKSFRPNGYGLFDMSGNVWEWTSDRFNIHYYRELKETGASVKNPKGADTYYNPNAPNTPERVIKGGSFLCSDNYCASYRHSSRMATTEDSAMEHLGFRTMASLDMILKEK